jgi:hypothetical protein
MLDTSGVAGRPIYGETFSASRYPLFPRAHDTGRLQLRDGRQLFIAELNRRLLGQQITNVIAMAAHPGFTWTIIAASRSERTNWFVKLLKGMARVR